MCLFPALEEREIRCHAGIQTHCQEVKDERGPISELLKQSEISVHVHFPPQVLPLLPAFSHLRLCVWGSCQSFSEWRGEVFSASPEEQQANLAVAPLNQI